jgi:hypothetical protein
MSGRRSALCIGDTRLLPKVGPVMQGPVGRSGPAWIVRSLFLVAAASAVVVTVATPRAPGTTQPEKTYWISITMTDSKIVLKPDRTVPPGSLVVFTVHNRSTDARNLVFGSDKVGFLRPGKNQQFELNFLLPWRITAVSVARGGTHRLTATFVCTY